GAKPKNMCSPEAWKEGAIITSPGFPASASESCEYVLEVEPGKNVETKIIMLESNSCCDNFIIGNDFDYLDNLAGEERNLTYTMTSSNMMKVSWLPRGGVNVRGFMMTFRGVSAP
ncbi:hypothetical protein PENTCL1PPCAC_29389, partial [Pristionchus entomophagus]